MTLSVTLNPISPTFSAAGQITPADVQALARQGFRSIVNNRPDGEGGPEQPSSAAIQAMAEAHGLAYVHYPVANLNLTPVQVAEYQRACAALPHPIVGFCKSGGRASALYQAAGGQIGQAT